MCSRKETCVHQNKCQIGGPLQTLLKIPSHFPKAILIVIDTQAQIYQYLDYIGRIDTIDRTKGFTEAQHKALLKHYGANEEGQPGKARSINEKGLLYHVCKTQEPKLFNFDESPDNEIKKHFEGEKAYAIPIPCGGEVLPLLIVFLKHDNNDNRVMQLQVMQLQNLIEKRRREIQLIVKDTRKESLGKLVSAIPDGDKPENDPRGKFSRWLLGWLEERDGLWLGNKLWFVVDHGLIHAKNLWKLANDLAREANLGEKLSNLTVDKMSPLIFSLAIWLHDIGYKGIHLPDWKMDFMDTNLEEVIQMHGIISAALIIRHKKAYNFSSDLFNETILARTGLVCAYHQEGCPIFSSEVELLKKELKIPKILAFGSNYKFVAEATKQSMAVIKDEEGEYLTLDKLEFQDDFNHKALIVMASLLRLLDSCDFNWNRVGSTEMIELRKHVRDDTVASLENKFIQRVDDCANKAKTKFEKADTSEQNLHRKTLKNLGGLIDTIKQIKILENNFAETAETIEGILQSLLGLIRHDKHNKDYSIEDENFFCYTISLGTTIRLLNRQDPYYKVHNSVVSVSFIKNKDEKDVVDLNYEIDNSELSKDDIEAEIKKEISNKTGKIYEKVLCEENILKIKCVKPFNKDFGNWIKK